MISSVLIGVAVVTGGSTAAHEVLHRPYVVVIDPGHGGHDPGALAPTQAQGAEKTVTLAVALAVRHRLRDKRDVRILLTRDSDKFLTLVARRKIAEANHADLFISIHADSASDADARGASIYTLQEDGRPVVVQRMAAAPVMDGIAKDTLDSDTTTILADLQQRGAMNDSAEFAAALATSLASETSLRSQPRLSAHFAVLKAQGIPAVLIETGYLTNASDAAMLFSEKGQKGIAKAIAQALEKTAVKSD